MSLEYNHIGNTWAIQVHTPILDMTEEDKKLAVELLVKNVVLVWKKQDLSPRQELDFIGSIGDYDHSEIDQHWESLPDDTKDLFIKEYPGILRVSGIVGDQGNPGHFPEKEELLWHSDRIGDTNRRQCVWLYGETGTEGSITRWSNGYMAYDGLSQETKDMIQEWDVQHYNTRYRTDNSHSSHRLRKKKDEKNKQLNISHKLVIKNNYGRKSLFLSPFQVGIISGMTEKESIEWSESMLDHLTSPEYTYAHEWEDGDVVIGEMTFGLHARDRFENIGHRCLHHVQFNLNKILPNVSYEGYNGKVNPHPSYQI